MCVAVMGQLMVRTVVAPFCSKLVNCQFDSFSGQFASHAVFVNIFP